MKITDVILDFDGTCTQIPLIYEKFLSDYHQALNQFLLPLQQNINDKEWKSILDEVHQHSPAAGWTVPGTTPSAPAAADPYILSGEAAKLIFKRKQIVPPVPLDAFNTSYAANPAPWRVETLDVIKTLLQHNVAVHIVTNSKTGTIQQRIQDLWGGDPLPKKVSVQGNASKYNIIEPYWDDIAGWPKALRELYNKVPAAEASKNIGRPLYLRRGSFASIIAGIFKGNPERFAHTVFCGDVWELDLALPAAMGGHIHLIERASPFDTYDFEKQLTLAHRGKVSKDLLGLKEWL